MSYAAVELPASTPRQIVLQQALGYSTPSYLHLPVALNPDGGKLSKQTLAAPIDDTAPLAALLQAGAFLGGWIFPDKSAASP